MTRSMVNRCVRALLCIVLGTLGAHALAAQPVLSTPAVEAGAASLKLPTAVESGVQGQTELANLQPNEPPNAPSDEPRTEPLTLPPVMSQVGDLALKLAERHQFNGVRAPDKSNTLYTNPEGWSDPLKTWPAQLTTGWSLPGDGRIRDCATLGTALYGFLPGGDVQGGALVTDFTGEHPLTLEQAVDWALCRNPQVRSAWAAIKVQAAALGEAKAADLPTFNMGIGAVQDETRYPGSPVGSNAQNGDTFNASLTWRLWDMGTRAANQQSARQLLDAALFSHDAVLQKLLSNVVTAYFDTQTAQAAWGARQQTEDLAQKTLDISKRRQNQGVGSPSDTLQAATALAKARLERSRAKGAYDKARSILVNATGLNYGTSIAVQEAPDASSATAPQRLAINLKAELGEWLERAMKHPTLQAARSQLAAAQDKIQAARFDGAPTLDFSTNYYQNGRPNQGLSST